MDEASGFRASSTGPDNAEKVHKSLQSSAQSRFGHLHWIGMIISFPRKPQGDFTLSKYEAVKNAPDAGHVGEKAYRTKYSFVDLAATWEVNLRWDTTHPMYQASSDVWVVIDELNVRVPVEFDQEFREDGIDALTRYMAQPPLTEGGFFENPETIVEAVNPNAFQIHTETGTRVKQLDNGIRRTYVTLKLLDLPPRIEGAHYFMHGDPGLKKDSFSLGLGHTTGENKLITTGKGSEQVLQKTFVDFIISWVPRPHRPVDLLNVEDTIMLLAKHFGVRRFTFDRWNSAQSIQRLVDFGIDADDLSFSNEQQTAMYSYLRLLFYNDLIELPPGNETVQNELAFLREKNGKIVHDLYGKDEGDVLAAVASNARGQGRSAPQTARGTSLRKGPSGSCVRRFGSSPRQSDVGASRAWWLSEAGSRGPGGTDSSCKCASLCWIRFAIADALKASGVLLPARGTRVPSGLFQPTR